jgi:hypothetical protein
MKQAQIKIDLKGLKQFAQGLHGSSAAVYKTLKQWGARYRSFLQLRYERYAAGGGDWPPLKPATIKRRKKGGAGGVQILRDTNTLFNALSPIVAAPGGFEEINVAKFSVTVGYGGGAIHPSSKSGVTIADIAAFHNFGMGFNPVRLIMALPDQHTINGMVADAQRNLTDEAKKFTNG